MEKESKLTREEHLEVMIQKYTQEIAACQGCECGNCQRSVKLWEEKLLEAIEELEGYKLG